MLSIVPISLFFFLDEAVLIIAYIIIINKLPIIVLDNKSPFEVLFDHKSDYIHLKVFRSSYYPNLRPYNKNKISYKSQQCIFLDNAQNYKGYICLSLTIKNVNILRNVLFDKKIYLCIFIFYH
ncbi:hypothetical protein AHAS_Ahas17G0189900 [Arachis hypogaea]